MRPRGRAALFDIDGTLFDSREAFRLMVLELSKELGIPGVEGRDLIHLLGRPDPEIADAIVPKGWPDRERVVETYVRTANERWSSFYLPNHVKAYPGVRQALEALRTRGYRIGVVSNGNRDELPLYLRHGGIEDLVEAVVSADDVPMPKPHPDGLLEACRRLGVSPGRAFYAGDTKADVLAAKAAGCISVAVLSGVGGYEELSSVGPDLVVDSVSALPKALDSIEAMLSLR
jgi:HAD superfamily hydrolase (TIGR01509 family)